jgi:hypothetical protein
MTYYDGQLINSCRMDEYRLFGGFLSVTERRKLEEAAQEPAGAPQEPESAPVEEPVGEPVGDMAGGPEGDGKGL